MLENHHAATVSSILVEPENDVLCNVPTEERRHCRKLMIKSILATDMAKHADMVKDLSDCAAQSRYACAPRHVLCVAPGTMSSRMPPDTMRTR